MTSKNSFNEIWAMCMTTCKAINLQTFYCFTCCKKKRKPGKERDVETVLRSSASVATILHTMSRASPKQRKPETRIAVPIYKSHLFWVRMNLNTVAHVTCKWANQSWVFGCSYFGEAPPLVLSIVAAKAKDLDVVSRSLSSPFRSWV